MLSILDEDRLEFPFKYLFWWKQFESPIELVRRLLPSHIVLQYLRSNKNSNEIYVPKYTRTNTRYRPYLLITIFRFGKKIIAYDVILCQTKIQVVYSEKTIQNLSNFRVIKTISKKIVCTDLLLDEKRGSSDYIRESWVMALWQLSQLDKN